MKTITKKYKVYTYDELKENVQQEVIDNNRNINVEYDWYEFEFEEMIGQLSKMGFIDAEIFFSGFSSQGDGACFATNLDIDKLVKHFNLQTRYTKLLKAYEITGCIKAGNNCYSHSNTMNIALDFESIKTIDSIQQGLLDTMNKKFADEILQLAKNEADKIYDNLQKTYTFLTSEESIVATFNINDCTFLEDGTMFNN